MNGPTVVSDGTHSIFLCLRNGKKTKGKKKILCVYFKFVILLAQWWMQPETLPKKVLKKKYNK